VSAPLPAVPTVLPSVMSADMLRLGEQLDALLAAGARTFHVDVMDGHFVPNFTVGTDWARAVAGRVHEAGGAIDVHLMVSRPGEGVELFAPLADAVSFHLEAETHPHRLLGAIRGAGCHAGLSINPSTPVEHVLDLVDELDYVNVLAINPGFAGQEFIHRTPDRIARLCGILPERIAVEVDGGITVHTLPAARNAGARMLVSASAIFGAPDPVASYSELSALAAE
jgi:ribulose-phosphate 3-epimerase